MDSTKTLISLGHAFRHCASTGSYWGWLIGIVILGALGLWVIGKIATKINKDLDAVKLVWGIAFFLLTAGAIFVRPANISQNTTEAQAAEDKYIGY